MLKYEIGKIMRKQSIISVMYLLFTIYLLVYSVFVVEGQGGVTILNLQDGQVVQGIEPIKGTIGLDDFDRYLVQFATVSNPDNWFDIAESDAMVQNGDLAEWDTTIISDGDYDLRLVVMLENGDLVVREIENLRVRNYTATETPTATVFVTQRITATPTFTAVPTVMAPTATPYGTNPAIFTDQDMRNAVIYGGLGILILLLPIAIYQTFKNIKRY